MFVPTKIQRGVLKTLDEAGDWVTPRFVAEAHGHPGVTGWASIVFYQLMPRQLVERQGRLFRITEAGRVAYQTPEPAFRLTEHEVSLLFILGVGWLDTLSVALRLDFVYVHRQKDANRLWGSFRSLRKKGLIETKSQGREKDGKRLPNVWRLTEAGRLYMNFEGREAAE